MATLRSHLFQRRAPQLIKNLFLKNMFVMLPEQLNYALFIGLLFGGEGGIRTPVTVPRELDFESSAFNRGLGHLSPILHSRLRARRRVKNSDRSTPVSWASTPPTTGS